MPDVVRITRAQLENSHALRQQERAQGERREQNERYEERLKEQEDADARLAGLIAAGVRVALETEKPRKTSKGSARGVKE